MFASVLGILLLVPRPTGAPTEVLDLSVDAKGTLYLLTARAILGYARGVSGDQPALPASALGLHQLQPPLLVHRDSLLIGGVRERRGATALWQCSQPSPAIEQSIGQSLPRSPAPAPDCSPVLSPLPSTLAVAAASPPIDAQFVLNQDELLRLEAEQPLLYRTLSSRTPRLRLLEHDGLLFANTRPGAAIGVYLPDRTQLGQQLDEILLLHPDAVTHTHDQVLDIARLTDSWWVLMGDAANETAGLYRFDQRWAAAETVSLSATVKPGPLLAWDGQLLLLDRNAQQLLRWTASGEPLAPLQVSSLQALRVRSEASTRRWRQLQYALVFAAAAGVYGTLLLGLRELLLKQPAARRLAAPLSAVTDHASTENRAAELYRYRWRSRHARRDAYHRGLAWMGCALSLLACGLLLHLGGSTGGSALLAWAGVCAAGALLAAGAGLALHGSRCQIGDAGAEVALLDHRHCLQSGNQSELWRCGPFIGLGPLSVLIGGRRLMLFADDALLLLRQWRAVAQPLPWPLLMLQLWQARHPAVLALIALPLLLLATYLGHCTPLH